MNNVEYKINNLTIAIDFKVELFGMLVTLSNEKSMFPSYFSFNDNNDQYIKEIENQFGYLRNHPIVIKFFSLMDKYNMHYSIPIEIALSLDDEYRFKGSSLYEYKDNEDIQDFCLSLKEFAEEIDYATFYNNHKNTYLEWIKSVSIVFQEYNVKDVIISYCGSQYNKFNFYVNLIPWETSGGYGIHLKGEAHNCLRARKTTIDNKIFTNKSTNYLSTSIHEYLHSIINQLTDKYLPNSKTTQNLFDKNNEKLFNYGRDYAIINETIIRAITIRILNILTKENRDHEMLKIEETDGFKYINSVYDKLLDYESNRNKFKDIDSFYLEIIKAFNF